MRVSTFILSCWLASALALPSLVGRQQNSSASSTSLGDGAVQAALDRAVEILGVYKDVQTGYAVWQSKIDSSTPITQMNIPGTHDSATGNYTLEMQYLNGPITNSSAYGNSTYRMANPPPPERLRCQQRLLFDQLNLGVRAFDWRIAKDVFNQTLTFHHSSGYLSQTASMQDVLIGYYYWLSKHPSETILLSINHEGGTNQYQQFDAFEQTMLYEQLTNDLAKQYFVQTKAALGTLGDSRGKIIFLRRFDFSNVVPASYSTDIQGLSFSPTQWTDNGPNTTLIFNNATGAAGTAYIEDLYNIAPPNVTDGSTNVQWKANATLAHLDMATQPQYNQSLFWSFASAAWESGQVVKVTPQDYALGINGTAGNSTQGMNARLLNYFQANRGKRFGIVMIDWIAEDDGLVAALTGV